MPLKTKTLTGSLCALGVLLFFSMFSPAPTAEDAALEETAPEIVLDAYGINQAAFQIEEQAIERNQTFSEILSAYNVAPETVRHLADLARPFFNVRHIRAGKSLRVYQDDSLQTARMVIYQQDPVNYVVFDLRDSVAVYPGSHPVTITQRTAGGVITSSPYQTLEAQGAHPAVAVELSKVFAWQVDFYHIQHGDAFKVVYEEHAIDGEPIGVGKILAARFEHKGKEFYAFNFGGDESGPFYDNEGNSLRLAFLKAPLEYSRISSRYTKRRFHPVQKRYKPHLGTDYAAPTGTPIRTTSDGVVLAAGFTKGNGRYVKIKHNATYTTGYLHMSKIASGMKPGRRVRQGEVIGYVGSTGLATGPHLCYRFWKNGQQVDPLREDLPQAQPIAETQREAFMTFRDHFLPLLQDEATPSIASVPTRQSNKPNS